MDAWYRPHSRIRPGAAVPPPPLEPLPPPSSLNGRRYGLTDDVAGRGVNDGWSGAAGHPRSVAVKICVLVADSAAGTSHSSVKVDSAELKPINSNRGKLIGIKLEFKSVRVCAARRTRQKYIDEMTAGEVRRSCGHIHSGVGAGEVNAYRVKTRDFADMNDGNTRAGNKREIKMIVPRSAAISNLDALIHAAD